jgi:hypothetical protein
MANDNAIEIKIDDKELKSLVASFKKMDKIATDDLKQISRELATEAASAVGSALQSTETGRILAGTIKVSTAVQPQFSLGGTRAILKNGTPIGAITMGIEFGSYQDRVRERKSGTYKGYRQFQPRSPREGRGNAGYFIFPTLKALQPEITRKWVEQVDRIRREWRERI